MAAPVPLYSPLNHSEESSAPRRQPDGGLHRQLTVAAVARPIRSSVAALGVLAVERSWWLLAQTTFARSSLQPALTGRASSPWSTRPAGKQCVGRRCPPGGVHPPGFGVRDP